MASGWPCGFAVDNIVALSGVCQANTEHIRQFPCTTQINSARSMVRPFTPRCTHFGMRILEFPLYRELLFRRPISCPPAIPFHRAGVVRPARRPVPDVRVRGVQMHKNPIHHKTPLVTLSEQNWGPWSRSSGLGGQASVRIRVSGTFLLEMHGRGKGKLTSTVCRLPSVRIFLMASSTSSVSNSDDRELLDAESYAP